MIKSVEERLDDLELKLKDIEVYILYVKNSLDNINKTIVEYQSNLDKKQVVPSYTDTILSKINILKNIIKVNIGDPDEFISPDLITVEQIENQIKNTGKISNSQFQLLNSIYRTQKSIKS